MRRTTTFTLTVMKWFERSAKQGYIPAINELGNIYEYGKYDIDTKIKKIADKVFKNFDKDYSRMWIANAIANEWGGDFRILAIASEIVQRQSDKTSELEELRYVQAEKYIKKAKSFGIDKWYIKGNCGEFCEDIVRMLKAYNKNQSEKPT